MCGIAGVLRPEPRGDDRAVVEAMLERLVRRGPDDDGLENYGRLTLGHRRLSILDLSHAGRQPMASASGRFVIAFNGEIYNHHDLREQLGLDRSRLRSTTDTEILVEAWERWGEATLDRLVGQFAFAVHDVERGTVWLARDRFGEKPLFWHRDEDGTVTFASSLGALVVAPWVPRELDEDALVEFVTLRYVVAPRTVLREVRKLPGGNVLRVDADDTVTERPWWRPVFRRPVRRAGQAALAEEFGERFVTASRRCLEADVPVALLLSDGIDSNAVRAALSLAGREVPAFTYRMADKADALDSIPAGEGGARTVDLVVSADERVDTMDAAFASFTEPTGDGASLATWLLIRGAREHATVFLCGHGGDEVLGGYRLSQDRFRLAAIRAAAWLPLGWTAGAYDRFFFGAEPADEKRRKLRAHPFRRAAAVARYLIHRPLPPGDVRQLAGRLPSDWLGTLDRLWDEVPDDSADVDGMQEVMLRTFLAENILKFADSVAMDSSAELRMPFLDRDLVDFVLTLPPGARVSPWPGRANTKLILRWWAEGKVDDDVVRRKKKTFDFGNLPTLLRSHGDELRSGILEAEAIRRVLPGIEAWLEHEPEYFRGPWEGTLWALLALGSWCRAHDIQ